MADSKIEWTDKSWNPTRGCKPVSPGCLNCYAMRQAARFRGPGQPYEGLVTIRDGKARWTGEFRFIGGMLAKPLSWRKPQRIFVNSMSDLFGEGVSNEEIAAVFGVMAACPQHTFQVLTKRAERMRAWFEWIADHAGAGIPWGGAEFASKMRIKQQFIGVGERSRPVWNARSWAETALGWRLDITEADRTGWPLPNVHLGVSAENQETADERIPWLLQTPAAVRWVSAEPLLGPVCFSLPTKTWGPRSDGVLGCNHCCNGDRCDTPGHLDRRHCPYCRGTGAAIKLDWVVAGGESGPGARACNIEWIRSIVRQCKDAGTAVFVKQFGAYPYRDLGGCDFSEQLAITDRKGGDITEFPADLRVRQFPEVQ